MFRAFSKYIGNTKVLVLCAFVFAQLFIVSFAIPKNVAAEGWELTNQSYVVQTQGDAGGPKSKPNNGGAVGNPEPIFCIRGGITSFEFSFSGCMAQAAYKFLFICSWVLWLSAVLFNFVIDYSLNMAGFVQRVGIVQIGWETFRDFANLFFIFIILFIAINTILGNSSYGIKNLLGKVIIGAMLINFSLFFTNVIVDASNIFALQFYTKIIKDGGGSVTTEGANLRTYDGGISASVAKGLGMEQVWNIGRQAQSSTGDESTNANLALNAGNLIIVGLAGGIFVLITSVVFFAGAFMFLARTIVLIFLMILSPLAFVGGILPSTQQHAKKWWSKLFDAAIFAPVYMALLYLVLSMVTKQHSNGSFVDIFSGNTGALDTLANFVILNSLMVGCLIVAKQMGAQGAGAAMGAVDKIYGTAGSVVGYSTFGLAAKASRGVIGNGLAREIQERTKNSTSRTGLLLNRVGRNLSNASFDARNIGDVGKKIGLGVDTAGGYKQRVDARNKVIETRANADFEALDAKGSGRQALIDRLQSSSRKGTIKVGDELAKKNIDDETKKQREVLSEYKDKPEYQEFTRLVSKANSKDGLSPAEIKRAQELKSTLESMEIDRKDWDATKGSWAERKGDKKAVSIGAIGQHGIEVHFDNVKNLGDHAFAANTFTRTKKHTAEKKKPSNP